MNTGTENWKTINTRPDIAAYYSMGQDALGLTRPKPKKGEIGKIMLEIAEANGVKMSAVYAARKVAQVISEDELAELIDTCAEMGFPLGKEHVTLLSTIPNERVRKKWRNRMLNE